MPGILSGEVSRQSPGEEEPKTDRRINGVVGEYTEDEESHPTIDSKDDLSPHVTRLPSPELVMNHTDTIVWVYGVSLSRNELTVLALWGGQEISIPTILSSTAENLKREIKQREVDRQALIRFAQQNLNLTRTGLLEQVVGKDYQQKLAV